MAAEIEAASAIGLDYWAFVWYQDNLEETKSLRYAWELYQRSPKRSLINWCMISSVTDFGNFPFASGQSKYNFKKVAELFRDDSYQRVQFSRPLIYLLWAEADLVTYFDNSLENFAGIIKEFRSYAREKNLGNPYIVVMAGDPEHSARIARETDCDAISNYISSFAAPGRMPFARLAPQVERFWTKLASTELASIPIAMVGWDTRPRQEQPVPWEHQDPTANSDLQHFYARATPDEFARHVQRAMDFVRANQPSCPANTILIYSWDECDEGGCILPTIGDPSGEYLKALGKVLHSARQ